MRFPFGPSPQVALPHRSLSENGSENGPLSRLVRIPVTGLPAVNLETEHRQPRRFRDML